MSPSISAAVSAVGVSAAPLPFAEVALEAMLYSDSTSCRTGDGGTTLALTASESASSSFDAASPMGSVISPGGYAAAILHTRAANVAVLTPLTPEASGATNLAASGAASLSVLDAACAPDMLGTISSSSSSEAPLPTEVVETEAASAGAPAPAPAELSGASGHAADTPPPAVPAEQLPGPLSDAAMIARVLSLEVRLAASEARSAPPPAPSPLHDELLELQRRLTDTGLQVVAARAALRAAEEARQTDRLIMAARIAELESALRVAGVTVPAARIPLPQMDL